MLRFRLQQLCPQFQRLRLQWPVPLLLAVSETEVTSTGAFGKLHNVKTGELVELLVDEDA
jgi:hypothetical protein